MPNTKTDSTNFTKLASEGLLNLEKDKALLEAVYRGDSDSWNSIFKNVLENTYTVGDFLKRYLADQLHMDYDKISDEELKELILIIFEKNCMKNIGTLKPGGKTTLSSRLKSGLLSVPVTRIKRETCFLLFFGLNMDETISSEMLTKEFRQADFNVRDVNEVIYYYCLKHNKQYPEIEKWLDIYASLEKIHIQYQTTTFLKKEFSPFKNTFHQNDSLFRNYLTLLKSMPSRPEYVEEQVSTHFKPVPTVLKTFKSIVSSLEGVLSERRYDMITKQDDIIANLENTTFDLDRLYPERVQATLLNHKENLFRSKRKLISVNCKNLGNLLDNIPTNDIEIPKIIQELLEKQIIELPLLTGTYFKKRIEDRTSNITRSDILIASFLLCTSKSTSMSRCYKLYLKTAKKKDPTKILNETTYRQNLYKSHLAIFESTASNYLEAAGYYKVYLLNPLELLLISCLTQEHPFEYFLAILKYAKTLSKDKKAQE